MGWLKFDLFWRIIRGISFLSKLSACTSKLVTFYQGFQLIFLSSRSNHDVSPSNNMLKFWCTAIVSALVLPAAGLRAAVPELDAQTFDNFVAGGSFVAILFHAPWCEFCKRAMPSFEQAGVILEQTFGVDAKMCMRTFEATLPQHEAWSARHLVEGGTKLGVPSIKLFFHGRSVGHAPRAISFGAPLAIAQFVAARALPQPLVLDGERALERVRAQFNTSAVLLGLFGGTPTQKHAADAFAHAARDHAMRADGFHMTVVFAASNSTVLWQQFEGPAVVFLTASSATSAEQAAAPEHLLPPWTVSRLGAFLQEHAHVNHAVAEELCDVMPCSESAIASTERFVQRDDRLPTAIMILRARNGSVPYVRALHAAAQKLRGRVYCVFVIQRHFPQLLAAFGVQNLEHFPVLVVHRQETHAHYLSSDSASPTNLLDESFVINFIESALAGDAKEAVAPREPGSRSRAAMPRKELELDVTGFPVD